MFPQYEPYFVFECKFYCEENQDFFCKSKHSFGSMPSPIVHMGPIVWLVHFHRFDHILVDSEDVPEYRGHCSKSSQLGLRHRCLDGPWIRNCTSWYADKTSGASTIIIQSKYTIINIHLLIFYGTWQVSKAFYSSASYHHFLSSRSCLQSCQGELLVWKSSWIGFSSQWRAWLCSPAKISLVVVCLFDDNVEGNDHRDDDCKDYDDDDISNAGDVSVAVDVVNILAMALCRWGWWYQWLAWWWWCPWW